MYCAFEHDSKARRERDVRAAFGRGVQKSGVYNSRVWGVGMYG